MSSAFREPPHFVTLSLSKGARAVLRSSTRPFGPAQNVDGTRPAVHGREPAIQRPLARRFGRRLVRPLRRRGRAAMTSVRRFPIGRRRLGQRDRRARRSFRRRHLRQRLGRRGLGGRRVIAAGNLLMASKDHHPIARRARKQGRGENDPRRHRQHGDDQRPARARRGRIDAEVFHGVRRGLIRERVNLRRLEELIVWVSEPGVHSGRVTDFPAH